MPQVEGDRRADDGGKARSYGSLSTPLGTLGPLYGNTFQTSSATIDLDYRQFALNFNQYEGESFEVVARSVSVPEPSTWLLLVTGIGMLAFAARGRRLPGDRRA
jgi:hypothetical protein